MIPGKSTKSTELFSDRVADYVSFRPSYPVELVEWLGAQTGMTSSWRLVDVGAGTGISSKLFLDAGNSVIAVEPNAAMRKASELLLTGYGAFRAIAGTAEATTLANGVADLVISAQAFHWFNHDLVRLEWRRILKEGGFSGIFWNTRRLRGSAFLEGYEAILNDHCGSYRSVAERYPDDDYMRRWFGPGFKAAASFANRQHLDLVGVTGRLMSSSYAPKEGDPAHKPAVSALENLFARTAKDGYVDLIYDTRIFVGTL